VQGAKDNLVGRVSAVAFVMVWIFAGAGQLLNFEYWWPCVLAVIVIYFTTVALIAIFHGRNMR